MIDDADLTSEWIIQNLLPILSDPERVVIMSEAASRMGRKDADVTLARQVMQIAQQGRSK
jgi:UDP-N-acetylglucosamine--N-acetylmuramyl-(pentapeptide) pyrophosphoryl-undecaprenol N-acetylglucosamine transferase